MMMPTAATVHTVCEDGHMSGAQGCVKTSYMCRGLRACWYRMSLSAGTAPRKQRTEHVDKQSDPVVCSQNTCHLHKH